MFSRFTKIFAGSCAILIIPNLAAAIPSPELVIGSAASVGQLLALLGATLGGGAAAFRMRQGNNAASLKAQKRLMLVVAGCIVVIIAAISGNIYQYNAAQSARLAHLQKTLNRPAITIGTQINDPNLKETSLSSQEESALGITADEFTKALNSTNPPALFDVREVAETLTGTIPGANHIRFPDIDVNDPAFQGKSVVLFCHNGNRSSEVCETLAALGIDCKFIVGGLEKWIVEGREFSDNNVRGLSDLRAIPPYDGKGMLFDTGEIETLITDKNIQFIDVRYPGEFALGHLPNAINIPLRAMPSVELTAAIEALPTDRPLVSACYDRRGCFISQVLGYEISKTGREFLGRYTVPWEYFVPKSVKPHVAAWLAEQNKSTWTGTIDKLAITLSWIADRSNFLVAIVVLAVFTRLLILPVALKSDRDQIVMRAHKNHLRDLKLKFKGDAVARGAAVKEFYRQHGMTPGRNMLALVFLPVTMLGVSAVRLASHGHSGLGFAHLGQQDPTYLIPIAATVLAGIYFQLTLGGTRRASLLIWLLAIPLMSLLFLALNAAANIYILVAIGLLFVQRMFVTGQIQATLRRVIDRLVTVYSYHFHMGILSLSTPRLLAQCGNKAAHLAKMRSAGLPVPDGVVLNAKVLAKFELGSSEHRHKLARTICNRLGAGPFAVRSSGSAEDGENNSFAGVYESVTDVTPTGLEHAIAVVAASFRAEGASAYGNGGQANILIQPMAGGEYSGVLFTRDPECSGAMLIERVKGAGEGLVSGRITPDVFRFGRHSLTQLNDDPDANIEMDFGPLITLGRRIETLFDGPQDIEWTFSEGQFVIVQSRNITVQPDSTENPVSAEWARIFTETRLATGKNIAETIVFKQDEMAEVLPTPLPLSLSLMQALWAPGRSVDIACQRLGLRYRPSKSQKPHLVSVMGRLYSNVHLKAATTVHFTRRAQRRLNADPLAIHRDHFTNFLRPFDQRVAQLSELSFDTLPKAALLEIIAEMIEEFTTTVHSEIETINIAAQYFTDCAKTHCLACDIDPGRAMAGAAASPFAPFFHRQQHLKSHSDQPMFALQFGHRAVYDYELALPRYEEDPRLMEHAFEMATASNSPPLTLPETCMPTSLTVAISHAVAYQALKESAKHRSLRFYSQIRRAILSLDKKLGFDGHCFYLKIDEFGLLLDQRTNLYKIAHKRKGRQEILLKQPPLPTELSLAVLEKTEVQLHHGGSSQHQGTQTAKRVAGDALIDGVAYVVNAEQCEKGGKLEGFSKGQILVCRFVHPTWLPFVLRSGGVVCELGGWLSHMAIIARERNVSMFVGAAAWQQIKNGSQITIDENGAIATKALPTPDITSEGEKPPKNWLNGRFSKTHTG